MRHASSWVFILNVEFRAVRLSESQHNGQNYQRQRRLSLIRLKIEHSIADTGIALQYAWAFPAYFDRTLGAFSFLSSDLCNWLYEKSTIQPGLNLDCSGSQKHACDVENSSTYIYFAHEVSHSNSRASYRHRHALHNRGAGRLRGSWQFQPSFHRISCCLSCYTKTSTTFFPQYQQHNSQFPQSPQTLFNMSAIPTSTSATYS